MDMKIRTLGRHIFTAVKNTARNGWMTFASVTSVAVTLFILGIFLVVMMNIDYFVKNLEKDVEIRALVETTVNADDLDRIQKQIKNTPGIATVVFSSKTDELEALKESFGDDGYNFDLKEQENPLKDVFVIKAEDPRKTETIAKQIGKINGIAKTNYGKEEITNLFKTTDMARNVGFVLIIALALTTMFLISNTIKITIFSRRKEIEIMKLVGATKWFIRWPFLIEGLFLGVMGALIPIVIITWVYSKLYEMVDGKLTLNFLKLLPMDLFVVQVSLVLLAIGAVIGMWGSTMSIRKFLRK